METPARPSSRGPIHKNVGSTSHRFTDASPSPAPTRRAVGDLVESPSVVRSTRCSPDGRAFAASGVIVERDARGTMIAQYMRGRRLGTGAFAAVWEIVNAASGAVFAAKEIPLVNIQRSERKMQKLFQEIEIQRQLQHPHIIRIYGAFRDETNFFMLLEKCENFTLLDLVQQAAHQTQSRELRGLTVPEVQYIMLQLLRGVEYLHSRNVIHRDLKLANLMVDSDLRLKIGDFGLATLLADPDEKRLTMCGTPNYIAPEILQTTNGDGYSLKADIWSIGVILYTLLVGVPPFETSDLQTTYRLIQACDYRIPEAMPRAAKELVERILQVTPEHRPSLVDIRRHPFFATADGAHPPPAFLERVRPHINQHQSERLRSVRPARHADPLAPPGGAPLSPGLLQSLAAPASPPAPHTAAVPAWGPLFDFFRSASARPAAGRGEWTFNAPPLFTELSAFPRYGVTFRSSAGHGALFNDRTRISYNRHTLRGEYMPRSGGSPVGFSTSDHASLECKKITLLNYFGQFFEGRVCSILECLREGGGSRAAADACSARVEEIMASMPGPSVVLGVPPAVTALLHAAPASSLRRAHWWGAASRVVKGSFQPEALPQLKECVTLKRHVADPAGSGASHQVVLTRTLDNELQFCFFAPLVSDDVPPLRSPEATLLLYKPTAPTDFDVSCPWAITVYVTDGDAVVSKSLPFRVACSFFSYQPYSSLDAVCAQWLLRALSALSEAAEGRVAEGLFP